MAQNDKMGKTFKKTLGRVGGASPGVAGAATELPLERVESNGVRTRGRLPPPINKAVRPKVYIACGISGQIQHLAGMQDSGIIISVNSDPDAPINAIADYVINGTVEEVLPKMIKYYKANNK